MKRGNSPSVAAVVLALQTGLLTAVGPDARAADSATGRDSGMSRGTAPEIGPRDRPRVALVWFDPWRAFSFRFAEMAAEVVSIFGRIGVDVTWRIAEEDTVTVPSEIQVILLNRDPPRAGGRQNVLGETPRQGGPCPVLWVRLPAIERALNLTPGRAPLPREGRILARTVARVIAHEIVHTLAPNLPHAHEGLMKDRFGPAYLFGERTELDTATVLGLLAALERPLGHPDAPAPPAPLLLSMP